MTPAGGLRQAYPDTTAMTERRVYYDTTRGELLLMIWTDTESEPDVSQSLPLRGWQPDLIALDLWRAGALRLYEIHAGILTMYDGAEVIWPQMIPDEHADITALAAPPWIPANAIYTDMSLPTIRLLESVPLSDPAWEEYLRPALDYSHLPPSQLIPMPRIPPPPPQPSAPPVSRPLTPPLRGNVAAQPQPEASPAQTWPPHIRRALLEHAAARGATCAITMEPIRADVVATADNTYTITPCGHVFVTAALTAWTMSHPLCPECRAAL